MNILGLMSGSSLDGLDMALCSFEKREDSFYSYTVLHTSEVAFPDHISKKLSQATSMTGKDLFTLDAEFSRFLGQCCLEFESESTSVIDAISSHGHTVFHFPDLDFSTQLGNGGLISQIAKKDVVCDFRNSDIGSGGQGAPFAPIADQLLFPEADVLVNIGGIINITFKSLNQLVAFDVSPANQLLNFLSLKLGIPYDDKGAHARSGKIDIALLKKLEERNGLESTVPRGLDNSWVKHHFFNLIEQVKIKDGLRTCCEFISMEIEKAIQLFGVKNLELGKVMITGGGALNSYLMELIADRLYPHGLSVLKTDVEIIKFKEAILMSLMGYLRLHREVNVLKSYTGASRDSISGCHYAY